MAARFTELDRLIRRVEEQSSKRDERIDKLVLAIGESIRTGNVPRA